MGYNKIIKSGNTVETYIYERELPIRPRAKRSVPRRASVRSVAIDGSDPLQREQYERKREDNITRASLVFRRAILANLGGTDFPVLITCTYKENQTDVRQGYKDFSSFIKTLRYKFGKVFRYIAVPEFQKRGAIHFHAMFWGLPRSIVAEERRTRLVGSAWGHGFVDLIQTDGSPKLSAYLTKYMKKSFTDIRLYGQKVYTCSRNILRPEVVKSVGMGGIEAFLRENEIGKAEFERSYETKWLGTGTHRIYKIK